MNILGVFLQSADLQQEVVAINAQNAGLLAAVMAYAAVMAIVGLAVYIYMSLAMMFTAKRLKTEPAWLAWIPIANLVLLAKMAKMHWWPVLLVLTFIIPFVNIITMIALFVFMIIWTWKICEARNKPGWWSILVIIPVVGPIWLLVMWGLLAWGE